MIQRKRARGSQPAIIGHRGARWIAVENTLESLRIAFEEGADGIEFDVQLTADGELVLFHDERLTALASVDARVADLPWSELRALRLCDRHGHSGRITHFDQILEAFYDREGLINLEIKVAAGNGAAGNGAAGNGAASTEAIVTALQSAGMPPWLLSSFDREALTRLSTCGVDLDRALLIDDDSACDWWQAGQATPEGVVALGQATAQVGGHLTAIHPHGRLLTPDRLELWRAGDFDVNVWTLNRSVQWAAAASLGVAAVITDDPGAMAMWCAEQGRA